MPYADPVLQRQAAREWARRNRDKVRAWQDRYRAQMAEFLRWVKLREGCVDCGAEQGAQGDPGRLHFHHEDGPKLVKPADMVKQVGIRSIMQELHKCAVVCLPCHRRRHGSAWGRRDCGPS
jgi:hypothetical protein